MSLNLKGVRICVLGCGKTGIIAIKTLLKAGAKIYAYDDNNEILQNVCKEYSVIEFNFNDIDLLFVSPGIPNNKINKHHIIEFAERNLTKIVSDIEILQETHPNAKYVGVTGTNGKSTTTKLISHILKLNVVGIVQECGNIGIPVLSVNEADIYVIELSSFQLDLLKSPKLNVAICINITPDHLNCYVDMNDYAASKKRVFSPQSINIISVDYSYCTEISKRLSSYVPISKKKELDIGVSVVNGILNINNCLGFSSKNSYELPINPSLLGQYNAENIAAAVCACISMDVSIENIIMAINSFKGLPHRMELVLHDVLNDVSFINDSKATNSASTVAALEAFKNEKVIWIAGGLCKDDGIEALSDFFSILKTVYLIGDSMDEFYDVLTKYGVECVKAINLENALNLIKDSQPRNCVVLLSPACASTDQWKNFEVRGNYFAERIRELFSN